MFINVIRVLLLSVGLALHANALAAVPNSPEPSLLVSYVSDRSNPAPLDGSALNGDVYIFVDGPEDIVSVKFYVDGHLMRTENEVPYDFAGTGYDANASARSYNVSQLSTGNHSISADVTLSSGAVTTLLANVATAGETNPPLPIRFLYSHQPDRSAAALLSGATVSGKFYAFVEESFEIVSVDFYIDGSHIRREGIKPYDLAGGYSHAANPFDLNSLQPGEHQFKATVRLKNGTQFDLLADATSEFFDEEPPIISVDWSAQPNAEGWNNTEVTVTPSCSDAGSGVASCEGQKTLIEDGLAQLVNFTATDNAGNSSSIEFTVNIDRTAPQLTPVFSQAASAFGWHNSALTVSSECSDALSGVASCPDSVDVTEEGIHQLMLDASDSAGNVTEQPLEVRLDKTAPYITFNKSAEASPSGWYLQPVTFIFACNDMLSDVATCPEPVVFNESGRRQSAIAQVTDKAENISHVGISVDVDLEDPGVQILSPQNGQFVNDPRPVIRLAIFDNIEIDPSSITLSAGSVSAACYPAGQEYHCQFNNDLIDDGSITIVAGASDVAGRRTEKSITTALDADFDQVADYVDGCLGSALGETVDEQGCDDFQRDSDGDGYSDGEELGAGSDPHNGMDSPALNIVSFTVSNSAIEKAGAPVQLYWDVQGAEEIELHDDATGAVLSGLNRTSNATVNPAITTNFTLVAKAADQHIQQQLTVTIETPPPAPLWPSAGGDAGTSGSVSTGITVADDGSSYQAVSDGSLKKLSPNGETVWAVSDLGRIAGKVIIAGDTIIAGVSLAEATHTGGQGRIYALGTDQTPRWQTDTAAPVIAAPALSQDGAVTFVATYAGELLALSTATGERLWSFSLPENQKVATAITYVDAQQTLYIRTVANQLFAINAQAASDNERVRWVRELE